MWIVAKYNHGQSQMLIESLQKALGEELAAQPRLAVKAVLDTIVGFETKNLDESIEDEKRAVAATLGTPDSQEGMAAFLEKRKPVFNQS